jgi:hypothetical protein
MKTIKRIAAFSAAITVGIMPALPVVAATRGLTRFYDDGKERGYFYCGANSAAFRNVPILGTLSKVGRAIAGRRYNAGVWVGRDLNASGLRAVTVSYKVKVDEKPRISHQEYSISDIRRESIKGARTFRVLPIEQKAVLTGRGERFGVQGFSPFTSTAYNYGENYYMFAAIKVDCITGQDRDELDQLDSDTSLSKDLQLLMSLLGARGGRRVLRTN